MNEPTFDPNLILEGFIQSLRIAADLILEVAKDIPGWLALALALYPLGWFIARLYDAYRIADAVLSWPFQAIARTLRRRRATPKSR